MPQYTQLLSIAWDTLQGDQFGVTGRTTDFRVDRAKLLAADRAMAQVVTLAALLSAEPVPLSPLGSAAPAQLLLLIADHPVDIRTNAPDDATCLSGVQMWALAGTVGQVYVTTGSFATTLLLRAGGGSNAVLTVTAPLP